jgi:hypothetical protein
MADQIEQQDKVILVASNARERKGLKVCLLHADAQFLLQFPNQTRRKAFIRLNLAAWKLPQARHWLSLWPLLNQDFLVRTN